MASYRLPSGMTVEHDETRHRFVVHLNGSDAELIYARPDADTMDLQHTGVPAGERGHGVAAALAAAAFDYARRHGLRVVPTCPFVRVWLERHPDQRDIVRT
jgi:uncharacterized protein